VRQAVADVDAMAERARLQDGSGAVEGQDADTDIERAWMQCQRSGADRWRTMDHEGFERSLPERSKSGHDRNGRAAEGCVDRADGCAGQVACRHWHCDAIVVSVALPLLPRPQIGEFAITLAQAIRGLFAN